MPKKSSKIEEEEILEEEPTEDEELIIEEEEHIIEEEPEPIVKKATRIKSKDKTEVLSYLNKLENLVTIRSNLKATDIINKTSVMLVDFPDITMELKSAGDNMSLGKINESVESIKKVIQLVEDL